MAEAQRTIEQIVSDALAMTGAPDPRVLARMSQGELLLGAGRAAITQAPFGLAARAPLGPSTAGVQMPPEASALPPAWTMTRRGYGAEPDMAPPANTNLPLGPPRQPPLSGERVLLYRRLVEQGLPEAEAMRWARNWRWFDGQ